MSASSSACGADTQAAWDLVRRFISDGDAQASFALYEKLQGSLTRGGTPAAPVQLVHTLPPTLLRECLDTDTAPPAAALLVCMLNRLFCLKFVPEAVAQAVDRRPRGLADLLGFYLSALAARPDLPLAAQRQLALAVAALALLVYDDITGFLWEARQSTEAGRTPPWLLYLLLISVMDILSDSRVLLGPLRRATQRRRLQSNLHIALLPASCVDVAGGEAAWLPLVELLDKAASFVGEGVTGDPQVVAAAFWRELPEAPVWSFVVHCYTTAGGAVELPRTVSECACRVLRGITTVDAPAAQLLESVVPPAMALLADRATCAAGCATLAAALEAATEDVVLRGDPHALPFRLISATAERLVGVLRGCSGGGAPVPEAAVLSACEGVGALTQALAPVAVPPMEDGDDAEDYACVAEGIRVENAERATAVAALHDFLSACQRVLLERLLGPASVAGEAECECIAAHLRRTEGWGRAAVAPPEGVRARGGGLGEGGAASAAVPAEETGEREEDFQVAYDAVPLAVFMTYERLCRLLGGVPGEARDEAVRCGRVCGVCTDAEAALTALRAAGDTHANTLLSQAALLPVIVGRGTRACRGGDGSVGPAWPVAVWPAAVAALTAVLEAAAAGRQLAAATHVTEAASLLVTAAGRASRRSGAAGGGGGGGGVLDISTYTGALEPLLAAAWRCLHLPGPPAAHWRVAEAIAVILDAAGEAARVPPPLLGLLCKQDGHTQAVVLSSLPLTSTETFTYILRCLPELVAPEEAAAVRRIGWRLGRRASALLRSSDDSAVGDHSGGAPGLSVAACDAYANLLERWLAEHPASLELVVLLSDPLPLSHRAHLRGVCLVRCFHGGEGAVLGPDISSEQLRCLLSHPWLEQGVADDVAHVTDPPLAQALGHVTATLLQPHPAYFVSGAELRLASVSRLLASLARTRLLHSAHVLALVEAAVHRLRDTAVAQGMSGESGSAEGDGGGDECSEDAYATGGTPSPEDLLASVAQHLTSAAAVVLQAAPREADVPATLQPLLRASDEFELRSMVRSIAGL